MTADEAYEALAAALRRAHEAQNKSERELAETRARLDYLIDLLAARSVLGESHKKLIDRVGVQAQRASGASKVRLRVLVDKYQVASPEGLDCASLMHLCHGRCCAFSFELTTQDLDEGGVRWEVEDPYVIRHETDGYCSHLDRDSLGCTIYERRPATCRGFDCRGDARVWIDFEQKIPAPMPEGLLPTRRTAR